MRRRFAGLFLTLFAVTASSVPTVIGSGLIASAAGVIDGPDVSSYQHPGGAGINWIAVRRAGHEFAIVKATEGTNYRNPYFSRDYRGIFHAGMVRGSYHFARPAHPVADTAMAQARYYVARLGNVHTIRTLPPALDLEVSGGLSRTDLITWAQDFLLDVRNLTGRTPMIYSFPWFWQHTMGDPSAFARYPLWMATYHGAVDSAATLWQYTSVAHVRGIRGGVDMSKLVAGATWTQLSNGSTPDTWTSSAPGTVPSFVGTPMPSAINLSWRAPDAGSAPITGYQMTVQPTGQVYNLSSASNYLSVKGLTDGMDYTFSIAAVNGIGTGATTQTPQLSPVHPTLFTGSAPRSVTYGQPVTVSGVLRDGESGQVLPDASVTVFTRSHGVSTWSLYQQLTTDASGAVSTTITAPRKSIDVWLYHPGPKGYQSKSITTTTVVWTGVAAALSSSRVALGHYVKLTGHITPGVAGVRVAREVASHGRWRVVAWTTTRSGGYFGFRVRPVSRGSSMWRVVAMASGGRAGGSSSGLSLRTI